MPIMRVLSMLSLLEELLESQLDFHMLISSEGDGGAVMSPGRHPHRPPYGRPLPPLKRGKIGDTRLSYFRLAGTATPFSA